MKYNCLEALRRNAQLYVSMPPNSVSTLKRILSSTTVKPKIIIYAYNIADSILWLWQVVFLLEKRKYLYVFDVNIWT
jgi:hypothetical protein